MTPFPAAATQGSPDGGGARGPLVLLLAVWLPSSRLPPSVLGSSLCSGSDLSDPTRGVRKLPAKEGSPEGPGPGDGKPLRTPAGHFSQGSFGTGELGNKTHGGEGGGVELVQGLLALVLQMGLAERPCCASPRGTCAAVGQVWSQPASRPPAAAHRVGQRRQHPSLAVRTREAFPRPLCFRRTPIS